MRKSLTAALAGAAFLLAPAGIAAAPAHANTADVTVSSPCYEPAIGNTWVYWTVTNNTTADIVAALTNDSISPTFTIPAGGSIVRETLGGYNVDVTVAGQVVASASATPSTVTACGTTAASFNLIVDCRPSPHQVTLRIRNTTDQARQYKLVKQRGEEMTGTALPGNTYITEDWVKPTDRWSLEIVGYRYVRLVNEPVLCNAPSPTPTPTPTVSGTPDPSTPAPVPTTTAPPSTTAPATTAAPPPVDPPLAPASNASGLDPGHAVLTVGLACLLVGSAFGFVAANRFRRRGGSVQ